MRNLKFNVTGTLFAVLKKTQTKSISRYSTLKHTHARSIYSRDLNHIQHM